MISWADKRRFIEQGYLLVEGVLSPRRCAAVRRAISGFLNVREDDPDTWSRLRPTGHGIVPLHHAQSLWDVRQTPGVHEIFSRLYGTRALWVSMDRVSFKAPAASLAGRYRPEPFHFDGDPRTLPRMSIQGLIYLTDTDEGQGAFCCVPEIYRNFERWRELQPTDLDLRRPDVSGLTTRAIGGPAGSLLVWHRRLPHTSSRNDGNRPRWTQYVTMTPAGDVSARRRLAAMVRSKRPPEWAVRQSVPGQQNPEPGPPVRLTNLGLKLAGIRPWPARGVS